MRILLAALLLTTACGTSKHDAALRARDSLTQHQKDSLTAQSQIPGARGVAGALKAQDTAAAQQRVVDSIANAP